MHISKYVSFTLAGLMLTPVFMLTGCPRQHVMVGIDVKAINAGAFDDDPDRMVLKEGSGGEFFYLCKETPLGKFEAFPDICRLNDGRLMAVFYAGYRHISLPNREYPNGGGICYCTSSDEGRTWTRAKVLYDGPDDERDPSIVQLKSGRLICNYDILRRVYKMRKGASVTREKNMFKGHGCCLIFSDDMGKTWSKPQQIDKDYTCSSPPRQLSDGRLVLGLHRNHPGSVKVKPGKRAWGAVIFSNDEGKTWGKVIDIDNGGMRLEAETDVIELKDGTLYAAQRAYRKSGAWSVSKDGGKTWSVSKPFGFGVHCPYLHRANNGVILLGYRQVKVEGQRCWATGIRYSPDECKTWSEYIMIDEVNGAYPSMVNLKDGSILVIYYEEFKDSSIRARRFRVTKDGIKWLSPLE